MSSSPRGLEPQEGLDVACNSEELFEKAKQIRDAISYLQRIGTRIGQMELEKQQAILGENYEQAKLKKNQIDAFRSGIERDLNLTELLTSTNGNEEYDNARCDEDTAPSHFNGGSNKTDNLDTSWTKQTFGESGGEEETTFIGPEIQLDRDHYYTRKSNHPPPPHEDSTFLIGIREVTREDYSSPTLTTTFAESSSIDIGRLSMTNNNATDLSLSDSIKDTRRQFNVGKLQRQDQQRLHPATRFRERFQIAERDRINPLVSRRMGDEQNTSPQHHHHHHHHIGTRPQPVYAMNDHQCPGSQSRATPSPSSTFNDNRPSWLDRSLSSSNEQDASVSEKSPTTGGASDGRLEPLSEAYFRLAVPAIDVVGLELVSKAFSKSWKFREQALAEMKQRLTSVPLISQNLPDARAELKSTVLLLRRALKDQVLNVFRAAIDLILPGVVEFADRNKIPRSEMSAAVGGRLVPVLFQRVGDTAARIRDLAKSQLIAMSKWHQLRQCSEYWQELLRPFSTIALHRLAIGRLEMVTDLYAQDAFDFDVVSLSALVNFTTQALKHRSNEVRDNAETLMVALYRAEDRSLVKQFLPFDDFHTARNPLYHRLFGKFRRIDDRWVAPTGQTQPASGQSLASQPDDEGSITPRPVPQARSRARSIGTSDSTPDTIVQSPEPLPVNNDRQDVDDTSFDHTCIFCGEQNEAFNEDGLDLHYWDNCPMLCRCQECKQVVEIANLTDHLLKECEALSSGDYTSCPQCHLALPSDQLHSHVSNQCLGRLTDPGSIRCPLCCVLVVTDDQSPVDDLDESWREHLLHQRCIGNTRLRRLSSVVVEEELVDSSSTSNPTMSRMDDEPINQDERRHLLRTPVRLIYPAQSKPH